MTIAEPTITPLIVPTSIDDDTAAEFRAYGELNRQICDEQVGLPGLALEAAQVLPGWQDDTDSLDRGFVARVDGEIVGMVTISFAQEEEGERRRDRHARAGGALGSWHRERAARARRGGGQVARSQPFCSCGALPPASEETERMLCRGRVGPRACHALSDLAESAGYTLEQVERNSEFDLHSDPALLRTALAEANAHAGSEYRIVDVDAADAAGTARGIRRHPRSPVDRRPERGAWTSSPRCGTPIVSRGGMGESPTPDVSSRSPPCSTSPPATSSPTTSC